MRNSNLIKKPIRKASKPRESDLAKKVVQRLKKGANESILKHVKVAAKSKALPDPKSKSTKPNEKPPLKLMRSPNDYNKILELPVYEPTVEEFKHPMILFKKLNDLGYHKYGCIKIRTPKAWDPEFAYNYTNKRVTTRRQKLRNLIKGKNFEQNIDSYTYDEFKEMAEKFQKKYRFHVNKDFKDPCRLNEFEYWALIEDPEFKLNKVAVEYAADLPTRRYGSAFPTTPKAKLINGSQGNLTDEKTHPFNLNNINQSKDSLFQIITTKAEGISGITAPWIYFGMLFASFCWHVEDLYMYSVNYMHKGAPKTWYCIPPEYKDKFDEVIRRKYADLFAKNPHIMYNIVLAMNPLELVKEKIPVYRTEQNPREFIVTFPKSYHSGFSHGFNVSEAVNIATIDWVPFAREAIVDYMKEGSFKKNSFAYEWLLVENVKMLSVLNITKDYKDTLLGEFAKMKDVEVENRRKIIQRYHKVIQRLFTNNLSKHDATVCMSCQNYPYLSYITCMVCSRKVCTNHVNICKCINATVYLDIRFTEKELEDMAASAKAVRVQKKK